MDTPTFDLHETVAKVGVGVSGSLYSLLDMPLSRLVACATFFYMLCQIIVIAPKVVAVIQTLFTRKVPK